MRPAGKQGKLKHAPPLQENELLAVGQPLGCRQSITSQLPRAAILSERHRTLARQSASHGRGSDHKIRHRIYETAYLVISEDAVDHRTSGFTDGVLRLPSGCGLE